MIETKGLGAGSYPTPHEVIDIDEPGILDRFDEDDDYDCYMADIYHEEMMMEMI